MLIRSIVALAAITIFTASAYTQTKLLRFPDISRDRIVFTYGGDLWTSSAAGGNATRLTAHPGVETYAKFSPDGKFMALEVIDSSGSALLDTAAAQAIQRRLRPKLSEMTIEGYSGREVWVPLLIVDWQIVDDVEDAPGHATNRYANGILTVVAKSMRRRNDIYNSCGFMQTLSIFI